MPADGFSLEEEFFPTDAARVQRWFPWLRLFKAFRIAISPRAIVLSLAGLVIWSWGDSMLLLLCQAVPTADVQLPEPQWFLNSSTTQWLPTTHQNVDLGNCLDDPFTTLKDAFGGGSVLLMPLRRILALAVFLVNPPESWLAYGLHWLALLWGLLIGGVTGGALSRLAIMKSVHAQRTSLRQAVAFAGRHALDYLTAPLTAFVGFSVLWGCVWLGGWFGRVPFAGQTILGLFWGLALLAGLFMAVIVVGVAAGWPLMVSGISIENSDGFDGLSRSYSYLFHRPWYALFLVFFFLGYGSALLYFVCGMTDLAIDLSLFAARQGLPGIDFDTVDEMIDADAGAAGPHSELHPVPNFGQTLIPLWIHAARTVPMAFTYSLFWTGSTLIYVLLRRREDGTPYTQVADSTHSTGQQNLPLAGIPAAQAREVNSTAN